MNRREAIIAGMAGITGAVAVAPTADAESPEGANPDLDQIRALLRAHDEAFTKRPPRHHGLPDEKSGDYGLWTRRNLVGSR